MKIAVDVMGTDYGPEEIILGAIQAVKQYDCDVYLVGDRTQIETVLKKYKEDKNERIKIEHASEVIEMSDHPSLSVKAKPDASIVVATRLLHTRVCDALVSAGSTGAAVAAALFGLGRIKGIERPAIATPIPSITGTTVVLDSGAKVDAKPQHLVQNAIMGSIYAELILKIKNPRVGLLNIGEEETKGNEQALATYPLLKSEEHINFIGNVEGRDINKGTVDVVVCDGFVGNVVLKIMEGLSGTLFSEIKASLTSKPLYKLGALLAKGAFRDLKAGLDYSEYGGAPLLGLKGISMISHGSSDAKTMYSAIRAARKAVESGFNERLIRHFEEKTLE